MYRNVYVNPSQMIPFFYFPSCSYILMASKWFCHELQKRKERGDMG